MWRVEVLDNQREPLFAGWFPTPTAAGEFVENTLELFLLEQAEYYVVSSPDKRIEYRASDAAACVRGAGGHAVGRKESRAPGT